MLDYGELTKPQARTALEDYVATLPGLVQRLRARITRVGGPELDDTVDSLEPLGPWFMDQIRADRDDKLSGVPIWWGDTPTRDDEPEGLPFTARQLRLIDEVQAYMAHVLQVAVPAATWVVYRDKHPRHARNGKPMLQLVNGTDPADARASTYYMALKAAKERPISHDHLRCSAIWSFEDAGLIGTEPATPAPEPVPTTPRPPDAPLGGDLVIVRGDYTQYLTHGPSAVEPLDEKITRQTLTNLGATLDDDEGDWSLPTLVWEVWLERDTHGTLRAIGWDTHFDQNLNPNDVHTIINGIWTLARALNAQTWTALSGTHEPFTHAYATEFINELT